MCVAVAVSKRNPPMAGKPANGGRRQQRQQQSYPIDACISKRRRHHHHQESVFRHMGCIESKDGNSSLLLMTRTLCLFYSEEQLTRIII